MFVGELLRRVLPEMEPGVRMLDLCAAPGGKTTDAAASLRERFGDRFSLLANEVMRNRFTILRGNVRSWGDPRVGVTSLDPAAFGRESGVFDILLTDVPCSGEGLFRKDPRALEDWSPETGVKAAPAFSGPRPAATPCCPGWSPVRDSMPRCCAKTATEWPPAILSASSAPSCPSPSTRPPPSMTWTVRRP